MEEVDIIPASSAAALAEWQSEGDCCNQQDKSQAETETELEIKRSDKSAGKEAAIFRIEWILRSFPKFLYLCGQHIIYDQHRLGVAL